MKYVKKDFNQKYRQVEITHRAEFSHHSKNIVQKKGCNLVLQPF